MTHTWKITELVSNASTGLVTKAYYKHTTEHNGAIFDGVIGDFFPTGSVTDPGFTTYSSLTESDVLTWLNTYVDKTISETKLENKINSLEIFKGLPW